jgi:CDP-diacylglycerol--glycerol-3-phosphate 3-phosphatidyltransferase
VHPACRPGTALAASLVIGAAIALALRGIAQTQVPDAPAGPGAPLLGARLRLWYRGLMRPLEEHLVALGVHPDALTWAQLGVSVLAGLAFARGAIFLAGWLVILAGTLDILDGGVARLTGISGPRGAMVDSLVDRYAEFATFVGIGAFFRDGPMLLVVVVACFGSFMVSYTRARAEGLGLEMSVGSAQRPERYVLLGFGAWISALVAHLACPLVGRPTHAVLVTTIVVLAAISAWTAVERARHVVHALRGQGAA